MEIIKPENQLSLYGYTDKFNQFVRLHKKNQLSNVILLNGPEGIGKSTFAYHFINYLLSQNENNNYLLDENKINPDNKSYKLTLNNIHPNFCVIKNEQFEESIKIDQIRGLLKFLAKSTYLQDLKIVLIDNSEYLNVSSSNALLKALEEPNRNTYFFIIQNNSSKLIETIKSRCIEFKFFLNIEEKKEIFNKILKDYDSDFTFDYFSDFFYYDSPGNLLKYLTYIKDSGIDVFNDKLHFILYLLNKYKSKNDQLLLKISSLFIELFYNDLSIKKNKNFTKYFLNKNKIINKINNMKKYNLDKKNLIISLQDILQNEA